MQDMFEVGESGMLDLIAWSSLRREERERERERESVREERQGRREMARREGRRGEEA